MFFYLIRVTAISNLNGVHAPRSKARLEMKAVAALTHRPAAEQLRYLAPPLPNVVGYNSLQAHFQSCGKRLVASSYVCPSLRPSLRLSVRPHATPLLPL
jgi:hypothetical protein